MTRTRLSIATAGPIRQAATETEQRVCSTENAVLFQPRPPTQVGDSLPCHSGHLRGCQIGTRTNPHVHLHKEETTFIYTLESKHAAQTEWLGNKNRFICAIRKV